MKNLFSPQLKLWAAFFVIYFGFSVQAQTKTNLEIFKSLVDSSISDIFRGISDVSGNILINIRSSPSYQVFENQIFQSVTSLNKNIIKTSDEIHSPSLNYVIEDAKVKYGDIFRNGLLGDYFVERIVMLSGGFTFQGGEIKTDNFYYKNIDTVLYDEISSLENSAYPFSRGELPAEPFLSNIFEPIVALTTAAIVITLFFTVRSK